MSEDIILQNNENGGSRDDIVIDIDEKERDKLKDAEFGDKVVLEGQIKQAFNGKNKKEAYVKPKYPIATDGAEALSEVQVDDISMPYQKKQVGDKIKVTGKKIRIPLCD